MSYSSSSNPKSSPLSTPTPLLISSYQGAESVKRGDARGDAGIAKKLNSQIAPHGSIMPSSLSSIDAQTSPLEKERLTPCSVTPISPAVKEASLCILQESATTLPLTKAVKIPLTTRPKAVQTQASPLNAKGNAKGNEANEAFNLTRAPSQLPLIRYGRVAN